MRLRSIDQLIEIFMHDQTVAELSRRLATGECSSVELTQHYLTRIEQLNGALNAFITVTAAEALAQAAEADRRRAAGEAGPLMGLPIAYKDLFCTDGVLTSCGSKMLANFVPPYDATLIQRFDAAGALVAFLTANCCEGVSRRRGPRSKSSRRSSSAPSTLRSRSVSSIRSTNSPP